MTRRNGIEDHLGASVTHALAALASVPAAAIVLHLGLTRGKREDLLGLAVYAAGLVMLFTTSALYHALTCASLGLEAGGGGGAPGRVRPPRGFAEAARRVFRRLDHACVLLFMAASATPLLVLLGDGLSQERASLERVWLLAAATAFYELVFFRRYLPMSGLLHAVLLGVILHELYPLVAQLPPEALPWVGATGGLLGLGVGFFILDALPLHHTVWHLCVVGAVASHYGVLLRYVV